jgi:hypothetical protein
MDHNEFLKNTGNYYRYYKGLGEKAMEQLSEEQLFAKPFAGDTDISIIVNHLSGNMLSRWTDFLTSDGEKEWRDRDREFEPVLRSKQAVMDAWDKGWRCLLNEFENLTPQDLTKTVTIRTKPLLAQEAIIRNLTHTAYHVGQIVFLAKSLKGEDWESLSIPKGKSQEFNKRMK